MKRGTFALVGCCVASLALGACSGSSKPHADAMPDMKQMEKDMMAASTPGPMHKWLTDGCGTWEGKCKMWMDPSQPATESTCTSVITSTMGGRFTRNETRGTMPGMDGKPMTFEGFGLSGYNNTTNKFECTWCDNMGTMEMNYTGTLSADHKTLTVTSHYFCPVMHKNTWMRNVETRTGPNTMTLTMYGPNMTDGKEYKAMEIMYTRKN